MTAVSLGIVPVHSTAKRLAVQFHGFAAHFMSVFTMPAHRSALDFEGIVRTRVSDES